MRRLVVLGIKSTFTVLMKLGVECIYWVGMEQGHVVFLDGILFNSLTSLAKPLDFCEVENLFLYLFIYWLFPEMEEPYLLIKGWAIYRGLSKSCWLPLNSSETGWMKRKMDFSCSISIHVNKKDRIVSNCKSHREQLLWAVNSFLLHTTIVV